MWYIVAHGAALNTDLDTKFPSYNQAKEKAEILHQSFGNHYYVVKVQTVWTTQTLDEAMKEKV